MMKNPRHSFGLFSKGVTLAVTLAFWKISFPSSFTHVRGWKIHWKELSILFFFFSPLCSAHPVDAALLPNEWHSSSTLSIAILQCIIAANKPRIDLCLYKNASGGNHHIGNKWMLIWLQGQSLQMPGRLFIYINIVLRGGAPAVQSQCRAFCSLK